MTNLTNITMLVHSRPKLTRQALTSLKQNTSNYKLDVLYHKAYHPEVSDTKSLLDKDEWWDVDPDMEDEVGTGQLRNMVIGCASEFTKGEFLYLSDNDVYFKPKWLEVMLEVYQELDFAVLCGGWHPFNPPWRTQPFFSKVLGKVIQVGDVHAADLSSWLWTWELWDKFGPFDKTPPGKVRFSEDVAMSQRLTRAGLRIGTVIPRVVLNCGLTDSFGGRIPGAESIPKEEGVLYE